MTSKDPQDLLGTVAAEGRDTVDLDEQHLVPRIRSRARRKRIIVAAAGLGTAAVIAVAAVAIVQNLGTDEPRSPRAPASKRTGSRSATVADPSVVSPRDQPLKLAAAGRWSRAATRTSADQVKSHEHDGARSL